jgi:hypothetical protein
MRVTIEKKVLTRPSYQRIMALPRDQNIADMESLVGGTFFDAPKFELTTPLPSVVT